MVGERERRRRPAKVEVDVLETVRLVKVVVPAERVVRVVTPAERAEEKAAAPVTERVSEKLPDVPETLPANEEPVMVAPVTATVSNLLMRLDRAMA